MKHTLTTSIFKMGLLSMFMVMVSCSEDDNSMMPDDMGGNDDDDEMVEGRRAELYVTNNDNGDITKFDITNDTQLTIGTSSTAAEGIYYDASEDLVIQASRSSNWLESFDVTDLLDVDLSLDISFNGDADLESPRELAVYGDYYVVADNGSNKFFVYQKTGTMFSLQTTVDVPFPVWGITFKGGDLYAVVDISSDLAVYYNFLDKAMDGTMYPDKRVTIEGIVRTHGLTYSGSDDVMVMTDIGDAANTDDDGGFHIINDFSLKFDALSDGDVLTTDNQIRVAGSSTLMGNPIDVAYDSETDIVYVSDIGTSKVLGFSSIGSGGNIAPTFNVDLTAASSIYFSSDETDGDMGDSSEMGMTQLYTTSTANGNVVVYDVVNGTSKTIITGSATSEGIYYSGLNDYLIQASRSNLALEYYGGFGFNSDGVTLDIDFSSSADLMSPREIAVYGNKVVVSDNMNHTFYVYSHNGSSFTLMNTFDIGFDVWGITFMGDDLLAIVDNSSDLAIFADFFANTEDAMLSASKRVTIEGIVRTHGITYSVSDDVLVMTDIGDAANTTDDGGIHTMANFSGLISNTENGGTIALSSQKRIAGSYTELGNPIDVAYDAKTKTVYISEIGNGKVLGFENSLESEGNVYPSWSMDLAGSSSMYLYNN
ncbi:autotransporter outer membrane beta-barrel domain-containing protein [Muricauda brasiliensis]|uniref:hypothetical protein n=1 Tax=Muricauda brasiliensis TaxID=2162892 RepID=UPI000D3ACA7A|nr:hypothetical protein [Muricauda brasiliensis]